MRLIGQSEDNNTREIGWWVSKDVRKIQVQRDESTTLAATNVDYTLVRLPAESLLNDGMSRRGRRWQTSPVIQSKEAEQPAGELVRLTGETTADAVTRALRERFERLHRARLRGPVAADELDKAALHCAMLPVLDQCSADEIVSYDENGLPD